MAVYRIKIVPYSKPDAPGEWIRVDCNPIEGKRFHEARMSIMQDIHAPMINGEVCEIVAIEGYKPCEHECGEDPDHCPYPVCSHGIINAARDANQ